MKKFKQLLSLMLILAMFLSLGMPAYAAAPKTAAEIGYGAAWDNWDDAPAEGLADVPVFEEPEVPEVPEEPEITEIPGEEEIPAFGEEPEAAAYPANEFYYVGGSGLRVTVKAPEGAFPADAYMTVTERDNAELQKIVDASELVDGTVVLAADISFANAAGKLQPQENVKLTISSPAAERAENPVVLHLNDAQELEIAGELGKTLADGEPSLRVENTADVCAYTVLAAGFSGYIVVDQAEVTVQDAPARAGGDIVISENTTWEAGNVNYNLSSNLIVNEGVTLTLKNTILIPADAAITISGGGTIKAASDFQDTSPYGSNGIQGNLLISRGSVELNNITADANQMARVIRVDSGTLTLNSATVTNGSAFPSQDGGGILIEPGASVILRNSKVNNNRTTVHGQSNDPTGGGISVGHNSAQGGSLTMYAGSEINYNQAGNGPGGVIVNGGTFVMYGGEIKGNQGLWKGSGGGVRVKNGGSFTLQNGVISDNIAYDGGGGVAVFANSTFTMNGGVITRNQDAQVPGEGGGGVEVYQANAVFVMNGGEITGNSANGHGGAIYCDRGSATINSGVITGNTSYENGGGIYCCNSGTVQIVGATITENNAVHGGGVGNAGTVTISPDTILYKNNGDTSSDDIYNEASATIAFSEPVSGLMLGSREITGWFDDGATRWDGDQPVPQHTVRYETQSGSVTDELRLKAAYDTKYFYIYHSSDGTLEAVLMPTENGTVNLVSKVRGAHRYGGYYSACAAVTGENVEAAKDPALSAGTTGAAVSGAELYTGEDLKTSDGERFWIKADAARAATDDPGNALHPTVGEVYYLKEVPEAYLCSRISYVYDWAQDYKLIYFYLLTAIDDGNYSAVQFNVQTSNTNYPATIVSSFAITQRNSTTKFINRATDFTGLRRGYIGYADATDLLTALDEGDSFTMTPQWITLDGVPISGTARSFRFDHFTKTGIVDPNA